MATKQSCIICQIAEGKIPSKKIFEDELVLAVLDYNGANPGHCFVIPKSHYPIIEQVPDNELARLFQVSNKIAIALFETMGVQGTNIFVANGTPAGQTVAHFTINVIPRKENDGINLLWQPKQLNEEEMSTVELKLKEQSKNVAASVPDEKKIAKARAAKPVVMSEEEEEYFSKQLRRLP